MSIPSFKEHHRSQLPALKLLIHMGWNYLTPAQALEARGGGTSQVLLDDILRKQLQAINTIFHRGKAFAFSATNIDKAIRTMRNLPMQEGYRNANKAFYELITFGRSFEQEVEGDKKSFSFRYIDWDHPENNTYHVTSEFSVRRKGSEATDYRPDIVLFINGIPMVVIECKSPNTKDHPIEKAIEQHMRNQREDGIRSLYQYSNLLISLAATHTAKYATTGTPKAYWSVWKEQFNHNTIAEKAWESNLQALKNKPFPTGTPFQEAYLHAPHLNNQAEEISITSQDKLLYSLCQPKRLLELFRDFILYEEDTKKITRYPQYFAAHKTLRKITQGQRKGGVIWHTQGSGKSLTMVMIAQLIAKHPDISNPTIVLVTDRIDLDDQLTHTFKKCQLQVENAKTGDHLAALLASPGDQIITTTIHKFETAVKKLKANIAAANIFVLVDEGHRTQYGTLHINMQKAFPRGCFIAFTGTPLMKKEKNTANKFGGMIDIYAITDAVADGSVVPLLYEGRHHRMEVNEKPLDNYFSFVAEPLTLHGKAALKRKHSTANQLHKAEEVIRARAWDISAHYEEHVQGIAFGGLKAKAQLVAPNKASAIKYRAFINEIGKVSCEVLISPPDLREGHDDAFEANDDQVITFWKSMMDKYGGPAAYQKSIINSFKKNDHPEIIIVVDKLLTGFDAPNNYVLYLTKKITGHALLQAIARVNRPAPGKAHGLIIDYFGNLKGLHTALETYASAHGYDAVDLEGTLTNINDEIQPLPQAQSEVWDIFKTIKNKNDVPAYEELLYDEALRHRFYEKLTRFARLLKLALSSFEFNQKTSEQRIKKYQQDAKFFLGLRKSVKQRYFDDLSYKAYEPQVQKLIDKHIITDGETLRITEQIDVLDATARERMVEKITGKAAKADHIAHRTLKAINLKMDEDPVYFKKLSQLIKDTIADYHQHRISEVVYLSKTKKYEEDLHAGKQENIPANLAGNRRGTAIYNLAGEIFTTVLQEARDGQKVQATIAEEIDKVISSVVMENDKPIIDWKHKSSIERRIKQEISNYFYDLNAMQKADFSDDAIDTFTKEVLKVAKKNHG